MIVVQAAAPGWAAAAAELARELALPLQASDDDSTEAVAAVLRVGADGLALRAAGRAAAGAVAVDFGAGSMRHRRRGGQNELLGRAVGVGKITGLRVLDATAGLGRDSFVLADLGCRVTLAEREPVVAALLQSGLRRAAAGADPWLRQVVARMELWSADARQLPLSQLELQDVIYLDPMFPPRDKSAAVKKEMALFQRLFASESAGRDAASLLDWARRTPVARVVVKRPLKAASLGDTPSHSIRGKAVRYDVYVLRALTSTPVPERQP
ncbi:class I SAM-dependent methyltransferase [Kineobactrum salinum]|uniref:Ribosomal RNA small subunit methyltransferase J n=1 Tax=Kineobactrum salinum TaxID=2708301 RepID=A0A6C0U417_9GAMM|nr:class I SAM-dependent methyltransferase [Kineobactrum salinum]QIB66678.1 class I SAM-dependent methyltransferase [Kineobactrum salinum]